MRIFFILISVAFIIFLTVVYLKTNAKNKQARAVVKDKAQLMLLHNSLKKTRIYFGLAVLANAISIGINLSAL